MGSFEVSVIIPVYNAEKFVRNAVESVACQDCVREIILIEDGSPDNALTVCNQLVSEFENVILLRHPGGVNRGAGASRNTGIRAASSPFITFLDADDTWCENRFRVTREIFENQPDVMGVYEAVGVKFYDQAGKAAFCKIRNLEPDKADGYLTNLKVQDSNHVYQALITGRKGYFNTSGVTIRKEVFTGSFFFNESLRLHQDVDLWIRLAYNFKFVQGSDQAVSLRGVHAENRISGQNFKSKHLYYTALIDYFRGKDIPYLLKLHLFKSVIVNSPARKFRTNSNRFVRFAEYFIIAMREFKNFPF